MEVCESRTWCISILVLACLPFLHSCRFAAATEEEAEGQWMGIVKAQHWTPEIPPTTYTRPGLVFAVLRDSEGNQYRRTLCDDINGGRPPKEDSEVPVALSSNVNLDGKVGIEVSRKILGTAKHAGADLAVGNINGVTFTPNGVTRLEMAAPNRKERALPRNCLPSLTSPLYQDKNGNYTVPVYVVVEALRYGSLTATYDGDSGAEVSAKLAAASAANIKADLHAKVVGHATLVFTPEKGKGIYIGTHLRCITTLELLMQVAATRVGVIHLEDPEFSAVADLGTLPLK